VSLTLFFPNDMWLLGTRCLFAVSLVSFCLAGSLDRLRGGKSEERDLRAPSPPPPPPDVFSPNCCRRPPFKFSMPKAANLGAFKSWLPFPKFPFVSFETFPLFSNREAGFTTPPTNTNLCAIFRLPQERSAHMPTRTGVMSCLSSVRPVDQPAASSLFPLFEIDRKVVGIVRDVFPANPT